MGANSYLREVWLLIGFQGDKSGRIQGMNSAAFWIKTAAEAAAAVGGIGGGGRGGGGGGGSGPGESGVGGGGGVGSWPCLPSSTPQGLSTIFRCLGWIKGQSLEGDLEAWRDPELRK